MSCCGQQRLTPSQNTLRAPTAAPQADRSDIVSASAPSTGVPFQYTGRTALTVIGPVSGRRYRFNGPNAVVQVDPRDRESLQSVPRLRRL
jgi:hypothetical protein